MALEVHTLLGSFLIRLYVQYNLLKEQYILFSSLDC